VLADDQARVRTGSACLPAAIAGMTVPSEANNSTPSAPETGVLRSRYAGCLRLDDAPVVAGQKHFTR
jgi:hypothetical protein